MQSVGSIWSHNRLPLRGVCSQPDNADVKHRKMNNFYRYLAALWSTLFLMMPAMAGNLTFVGPGYGFGVAEPDGWLNLRSDFAAVLFHPKGTNPDSSPIVIYARAVIKTTVKVGSIAELNALDLKGMRGQWPKVQSKKVSSIRSLDGAEGAIYEFTGGNFHELVAYFDQDKTIVLFVLSSEGKPPAQDARKTWKAMTTSYRWLPELAGR